MIEQMLKASGDFGAAQWLMLSLFCVVNVLSAFHYFAQTFITLQSEQPCSNPHNVTNSSANTASEYDFVTLNQELGWTCDRAWMATVVQSMFFIGSVVGNVCLGVVADGWGRRPALVIANLTALVGNMLTANLIPSLPSLGLARFVAGLAVDSNFFMMYILVMEYISPGMRTIGLNMCIGVWYCVGCMATPWVAMLCREWRTFLTAISLPMLIVPLFAYYVPESAQWLFSRGKEKEAIECFKMVAAINRKTLPKDFPGTQFTPTQTTNSKNSGNVKDLFRTPNLRRKYCILIFKTMVLTLCYDAISRNIQGLGYDPLILFTVTSATILPSCIVILLLQDKVGRKAMAVVALLLTGLLNLLQGGLLIMGSQYRYAAAIVAICSRFAVNIAYNSGTQYAAELIPAQVRGQGLSIIHVVGYVAAFFSPYVLYMGTSWIATPVITLGVLSIVGAGSCMFLPETSGRTLPVTLKDGEEFGEREKFWDFIKTRITKTGVTSSQL